MKKFVKRLSRLLMCILCVACLSGCSNQPKLTTVDEVVQALKDAGYTDAYHKDDSTHVYLSYSDDAECLNFCNLSRTFDNLDESKLYVSSSEYHWYRFSLDIYEEKDYSKVLDTVMPFFDLKYENNGSEIIDTLWEYNKNSEYDYIGKDGNCTTKKIIYERNKYTVSYYLHKISNDDYIITINIRDV